MPRGVYNRKRKFERSNGEPPVGQVGIRVANEEMVKLMLATLKTLEKMITEMPRV